MSRFSNSANLHFAASNRMLISCSPVLTSLNFMWLPKNRNFCTFLIWNPLISMKFFWVVWLCVDIRVENHRFCFAFLEYQSISVKNVDQDVHSRLHILERLKKQSCIICEPSPQVLCYATAMVLRPLGSVCTVIWNPLVPTLSSSTLKTLIKKSIYKL